MLSIPFFRNTLLAEVFFMELTVKQRKETGAFYTPKIWADLSVKKIKEVVPDMESYFFYDPAAGEGALLEALPKGCVKYGTSLEWEDVEILRNKGIMSHQMDFFEKNEENDDWFEYLKEKDNLIIFMNPPFFKLNSKNESFAYKNYGNHDATALFFYRILKEINPVLVCSWNKLDLYSGSMSAKFREDIKWWERLIGRPIITPSESWGLSGKFPIGFQILHGQ